MLRELEAVGSLEHRALMRHVPPQVPRQTNQERSNAQSNEASWNEKKISLNLERSS